MAHQRSKAKRKALKRGPTAPKSCTVMIGGGVGAIPTPCGGRAFKAGRCTEHYRDWRNGREARGIEARAQRLGGKKNKHGRVSLRTVRVPVRTTTYVPKHLRTPAQAVA